MLHSIAVTSLATVVPASANPVLDDDGSQDAWQTAQALAKELSNILAKIDGGRWFALVHPMNENGASVSFGDLKADQDVSSTGDSDIELVALGNEHAELERANRAVQKQIMDGPHQSWLAEIKRRNLDWNTHGDEIAEIEKEVGLAALRDRNDAFCDRLGKIENRARLLKPSTFAGLRAKFLIAHGVLGPEYADGVPRDDQDWHVLLLNEFMDDLSAFAGSRA
jgi:hypothetical protein